MVIVRLQIEIEKEKLEELKSLMRDCGIRTKKDLFNNALTLFKWAVNKRKSGHEIMAVNTEDDHYVEFDMPSLSAVRKS